MYGRPMLISGGEDGAVRFWDVLESKKVAPITVQISSQINGLVYVAPCTVIVGARMGLMVIKITDQRQESAAIAP
jgi:hypothetical protein